MSGEIYDFSFQLAAAVGMDNAIEIESQLFDDLIFPGCGEALRNVWRAIRPLLATGIHVAAASGAEHELDYYGADQ